MKINAAVVSKQSDLSDMTSTFKSSITKDKT